MSQSEQLEQEKDYASWFEGFIVNLKTDQLTLETGVASEEKQKMYHTLMSNDIDKMVADTHAFSRKALIIKMMEFYIQKLNSHDVIPNKMAAYLSGNKVMIWVEINEDDEALEDFLIMTQAKVNAKYHKHGCEISTMIVEDCDNIEVPSQYQNMLE